MLLHVDQYLQIMFVHPFNIVIGSLSRAEKFIHKLADSRSIPQKSMYRFLALNRLFAHLQYIYLIHRYPLENSKNKLRENPCDIHLVGFSPVWHFYSFS